MAKYRIQTDGVRFKIQRKILWWGDLGSCDYTYGELPLFNTKYYYTFKEAAEALAKIQQRKEAKWRTIMQSDWEQT